MRNLIRKFKRTASKIKIALVRARDWSTYLNFFMILFITISSVREYESFKFLTNTHVVLILITAIVGMTIFGWIDLNYGLYKAEMEKLSRLNPIWVENFKRLDRIEEKVNKLGREN